MDSVTTATASREFDALLSDLSSQGVQLAHKGLGQLALSAPTGGVSDQLLARVRERKAELLEWLSQRKAEAPGDALPRVEPDIGGRHEAFPLGDLQTAFAMGDGEDMEFHVRPHYYVESEFAGLDISRYESALNRVLHRQQASLCTLGGDMRLHPLEHYVPVHIEVHDLRALPPQRQQQALHATRIQWSRRTLPLDRWPWFDCAVSLHGDNQARLHWNHNDGFGTTRLLADVQRLYDEPKLELPPLSLSYRDCVLALQRLEASASGERSRDYWMQRLPGLPGPPPVPLAAGLNPRMRSWLERRDAMLPAAEWAAFKAAARQHGLTPTNALFAAYAEVLACWSGARHFLLNNMVTHRLPLHPEIRDVLGNFASLYPLEVDWREPAAFAQRARQLQVRISDDLEHTHYSGVKVLQALNQLQKTPGRAPCPFVVGSGLFMPPLARPHYGCLETSQVMLDHQFWELRDGSLWFVWDVIEACFPPGLVDAMWHAFQGLIRHLAADPKAWDQAEFDLLPQAQREHRARANDTAATPPSGLLHEGLARSAARWPGKAAVIDRQRTLTYAQLHCHANRLAHALRGAGVKAGDRVAILLDKGWHQVVAAYGVARAGAAYVPVDPDWPAARIEQLVAGVQAAHIVSRRGLQDALALPPGIPVLCVDGSEQGYQVGTTPPPVQGSSADLAYIIFTSGSTGQPKGVMIDHRGALNTVADINRRFAVNDSDTVFGISSLCFDLSVYDLFGPLAVGATLVLPSGEAADPQAWLAQLRHHNVTVWNSVPALMQLLVDAAQAAGAALPALRTVMLSGDWIPVPLPGQIRQCAPNARVHSLGGATEASIWSIHYPVGEVDPRWPSIPYGLPLANQRWHVLQDDGREAPDWVPGQLHVAGDGLALGYWQDEAKTAAAFVRHPRTGERLYRTGDLGRWLPGGPIEFLGRADFQVKIHGYRVELGEIEHALLAHPGVDAGTVLATGGKGGRQLVAFAVAAPDGAPSSDALLAFLRTQLPVYMVPASIVWLDRLPLNATGKVDRQALLAQAVSAPSARERVAPRSPLETAIAGIWEEVLEVSGISVHDDFFDLGGQSFAAVRVLTQLAHVVGHRLPMGALLEGRTVARLAEIAAQAQSWSPLVELRAEGNGTPCFFVHPAGGNVLCYRALAQRLERPFFAFQAPGLQGEQPPLDSVEALAALYVRALRGARPRGPYVLGGWSSGGVIAFEMARQLERGGETVSRLVMLDSPAPVPRPLPTVDSRMMALWFLQDLDIGFDPAAISPDELPDGPPDRQLGAALALAAARQATRVPVDFHALKAIHAVFRGVLQATHGYCPAPGAIEAPIAVLRATEGQVSEFADHPDAHADDWGWSHLTRGTARSSRVAGNHYSMFGSAHEGALARAVAAHLEGEE